MVKGKRGRRSADVHGTKDSVKKGLAALSKEWDDVEEISFGDVEDGKYQVRIEAETNINNSKASGRLQCSWTFTIMSGPFKGRKLFKHDGLEDEVGLGYFRGSLARLGVDWPDSPEELPAVIEELFGTYAQVTARTKKDSDIQNIYFDKAIDTEDLEEEDEESKPGKAAGGDEPAEIEKGSRVSADFDDGETYEGKVTELSDDGESATVRFDDGEALEMSLDELTLLEEGGNGDQEKTSEEKGSSAGVELNSKAKEPSSGQAKKIKTLAKEQEFDPKDYDDLESLLCDIAEYVGVEGKYKTVAALLSATEEAA